MRRFRRAELCPSLGPSRSRPHFPGGRSAPAIPPKVVGASHLPARRGGAACRHPNPCERVIMSLTDDPNDPALTRGVDDSPVPQAEKYLVLTEQERAKGYARPLRRSYVHDVCGVVTTMNTEIAETYARQPDFYGATYCAHCRMHRPVGENGEFTWDGSTEKVGT